jgi:hypothetical protein
MFPQSFNVPAAKESASSQGNGYSMVSSGGE